ncbi:OLC1v1002773C1 [Oldenlandia corymbosa var. corymbosa]|uniref:OLC1v1002773C1 n=1 Tax=Oldenlandia corymbosa var. corymbosa TaxID=529605 RepID=A0AAV1D8M6_OLDCO|nr:OLC1v1002773C1 [Oldenlandia corymbosa var. corymbosa]
MSISDLPGELLAEVLAKIPAKSLLKLGYVSKSWKSLIDSPEFVKFHLNRGHSLPMPADRPIRLILLANSLSDGLKYYAAEFDSPEKVITSMVELELGNYSFTADQFAERTTRLIGSCNGLVCIAFRKAEVALWNPSIRDFRVLPYSPPVLLPDDDTNNGADNFYPISYGFGYDDISDDYKVIRVANNFDDHPAVITSTKRKWQEVKVYNLKSDSWKTLSDFPHVICLAAHKYGAAFVNHALHWTVDEDRVLSGDNSPRDNYEFSIAAIDLRTEKFYMVPPPPGISMKCLWVMGVLGGCLTLHLRTTMDLWIMKDYGLKDSWTRLTLNVGKLFHPEFFVHPRGVTTTDHKELIVKDYSGFVWCNINKHTIKKKEEYKDCWNGGSFRFGCVSIAFGCELVDSLVRPRPSSGCNKNK